MIEAPNKYLYSVIIKEENELFDKVIDVYMRLFPEKERMSMKLFKKILKEDCIKLYAYLEDNEFCGFTLSIEDDTLVYLLFFAVNDKIQSQGYGSAIMKMYREENKSKPIIFCVENPNEKGASNVEQRNRRIQFYEKNGFVITNTKLIADDMEYLVMGTQKDVKDICNKSENLFKMTTEQHYTIIHS